MKISKSNPRYIFVYGYGERHTISKEVMSPINNWEDSWAKINGLVFSMDDCFCGDLSAIDDKYIKSGKWRQLRYQLMKADENQTLIGQYSSLDKVLEAAKNYQNECIFEGIYKNENCGIHQVS